MEDAPKQANLDQFTSMIRKLITIVVAAAACFGLYYLDSVKHSFDEDKSAPVLVDQVLKDHLGGIIAKKDRGGPVTWEQLRDFIVVDQYTAEGDFINTVAAQISASAQANEFVAQETFKKCVAGALAPPPQNQKSRKSKAPPPVLPDPEKCAKDYLAQHTEHQVRAENLIANLYRYIKPLNLRDQARRAKEGAGLAPDPQRDKNFAESSVQFMLNEKGSLHIVFQILRIALIVIIAFALISFVVLLLTKVMLSDAIKVFTDRAAGFIDSGKASIGPAAQAGVLTVAALGVGGAFIAGAATNTSAGDVLTSYQREGGAVRRSSPNAQPQPVESTGEPEHPNIAHYDGSNIKYTFGDSGNIYDYSQKDTLAGNSPPPAVNVQVFPNINIPERGSMPTTLTLDSSVNQTLHDYLVKLTDINEKMNNPTSVSTLLTDHVKVTNPPVNKDPIVPEDQKTPFLIRDADKGLISNSISGLQTSFDPIQGVADSLDDLQANSLNKPMQPTERSGIGSLLRGSDKYFVSKPSLQQLEDLVTKTEEQYELVKAQLQAASIHSLQEPIAQKILADLDRQTRMDAVILDALQLLYLQGGKPVKRGKLVDQLEETIRVILSRGTDNSRPTLAETLKHLESWEDTILTYTRVG